MEILDILNECTIVSGQINRQNFIFKNRDKMFHGKYKIIHEIIKGVEIAYASDDTHWIEGMNEYGVGFVFAFLPQRNKYDYIEKSAIKTYKFLARDFKDDFHENKIDDFKDFLLSKSADELRKKAEKKKWNGNYFIGDTKEVFSLEIYKGAVISKTLNFDNNEHYVRTNNGIDTIGGYAVKSKWNIDGSSSYLRKYGAENSLQGFKNYIDVIKRMSFQEYDEKSQLNIFKTSNDDLTVAQYFMDLENRIFVYVISKKNGSFFGLENKLPDGYNKKISILIKSHEEYSKEETGWDIFKGKMSDRN